MSSPATVSVVYSDPVSHVLKTVTLLPSPLATAGFVTLEQLLTIPLGVTEVRIVLTGFAATDLATAGSVTFDNVGLFEV
jgi:hypothetical protein